MILQAPSKHPPLFGTFSKHQTCKSKQRLTYAWQQTDAEVKVYIPFDQSEDTWMSAILDFFSPGKKHVLPKRLP